MFGGVHPRAQPAQLGPQSLSCSDGLSLKSPRDNGLVQGAHNSAQRWGALWLWPRLPSTIGVCIQMFIQARNRGIKPVIAKSTRHAGVNGHVVHRDIEYLGDFVAPVFDVAQCIECATFV